MTLALELSFDASSERRIRQLWIELSHLYPAPGIVALGGEPHVSLAVFRHGEPAHINRVVSDLAGRLSSFNVQFSTVGAFRTDEGVVFLAPEPSSELRDAHAHMMEVLGAEGGLVEAYYRPSAWLPHCTVAFNVPGGSMDAVIDACQHAHTPFEARIRRLSAVRYRPPDIICSAELAEPLTESKGP